jgi:nitric oxide reductase large subunit
MQDQHSPDSSAVKNVRCLFAFLAILMLMVSQMLVYTSRIQDNVIMPAYVWLDTLGLILFFLSLSLRPSPRVQASIARLQISAPVTEVTAPQALATPLYLEMRVDTVETFSQIVMKFIQR